MEKKVKENMSTENQESIEFPSMDSIESAAIEETIVVITEKLNTIDGVSNDK